MRTGALLPDVLLRGADDVPYEALYAIGFRAVLFDIDNTIVPHGFPADAHAVALFRRIHAAGLRTALISNNREERVKPLADAVGARYVHKAGKPAPKGFTEAMRMIGGTKRTTFFVGDQIFTDVLGASAAGLRTILVEPIHPKEEIQIVLKRYLEKPLVALYRRRARKRGVPADDLFLQTILKETT